MKNKLLLGACKNLIIKIGIFSFHFIVLFVMMAIIKGDMMREVYQLFEKIIKNNLFFIVFLILKLK